MKATLCWVTAVSLLLGAAGCGGSGTTSQATQTDAVESATPLGGTGHAPPDAVPGSYEDWCGEHQVPESQDTRCNPSLIPAFQAANDWCADHGLPMSQCTIHNPNLKIVRPPKPEGK